MGVLLRARYPCTDSRPILQSGASYCASTGAADFHRASLNFYFPPNVSIAGRVWKSGCTEWHEVPSSSSSSVLLSSLELSDTTIYEP